MVPDAGEARRRCRRRPRARVGVVVRSVPPASVEARSERTGFCVVTVVIAVPFEVVGVR